MIAFVEMIVISVFDMVWVVVIEIMCLPVELVLRFLIGILPFLLFSVMFFVWLISKYEADSGVRCERAVEGRQPSASDPTRSRLSQDDLQDDVVLTDARPPDTPPPSPGKERSAGDKHKDKGVPSPHLDEYYDDARLKEEGWEATLTDEQKKLEAAALKFHKTQNQKSDARRKQQ